MALAIFIGVLMPSCRGVLWATLAAIPLSLVTFEFLKKPIAAAEGDWVPTLPGDWPVYVAVVIEGYVLFAAIALLAYGVKRLFREKRAA